MIEREPQYFQPRTRLVLDHLVYRQSDYKFSISARPHSLNEIAVPLGHVTLRAAQTLVLDMRGRIWLDGPVYLKLVCLQCPPARLLPTLDDSPPPKAKYNEYEKSRDTENGTRDDQRPRLLRRLLW